MDTLDDIANSAKGPAATPQDEEEKKRKKKRNVLLGLAALAVIGGSAVCLSTGIVDKLQPRREPTEATSVVVEPTRTAYASPVTPLETAVTLSPTPTAAESDAYDVREAWYGNYDGFAVGRKIAWDSGTVHDIMEHERLWLEIVPPDQCAWWNLYNPFCDENRLWGLDIMSVYGPYDVGFISEILLYMPENLSDAPNLTITDTSIHITPTPDHPYELLIERVDGTLRGYLRLQGSFPEEWTEDAEAGPDIDSFEAERTTERSPLQVSN